jgi:hypothetical protein
LSYKITKKFVVEVEIINLNGESLDEKLVMHLTEQIKDTLRLSLLRERPGTADTSVIPILVTEEGQPAVPAPEILVEKKL